ncbi:MAG: LysR family transcriptional regulator [Lachnospiraceae bacterium]|nr:LysR family transcriptional regulator [Lachnospiraceae bacterium]
MSTMRYRALLTAIDCGSLTRAAEVLGYTQPGISHMITTLEQEVGFPILVRKKEGVVPTENAKELIFYFRQIVDTEDRLRETVSKINGLETGSLRIGSYYSILTSWLPGVIRSYSERYPRIDMQLLEGDHGDTTTWLTESKIDFALMAEPAPEGFEFIPLQQDPVMAVLPVAHPLHVKKEISPADLLDSPFIIPGVGVDEDYRKVVKGEHLNPHISYRVKGDAAILFMVAQGLGVTFMPKLLLSQMPAGAVAIPLNPTYTRTLGIAIRSEKYAAPAVKKMLEMIKEAIRIGNASENQSNM